MKKMIITFLMIVTTLTMYAQKQVPFIAGGGSVAYTGDLSYGFEAGMWGIESPLSYAVTVYATPKYDDMWVGVKPYWTVFDKGTWTCMAYAYPQVNIKKGGMLLEEGIGLNYGASKNLLLGYYLGAQNYKENSFSPFVSFSAVVLFRK